MIYDSSCMLSTLFVALSSTSTHSQAATLDWNLFISSPTLGSLLSQEDSIVSSKLLGRVISVWVIVVSLLASDIVLVVHVMGTLLGLMVSTLAVVGIHA